MATQENTELRDFLLVVRDALLMIVRWIERRYNVQNRYGTTAVGLDKRRE